MQVQLSVIQRNTIAEKLIELGNLTATALVVSQALDTKQIKFTALFLGLVAYLVCFALAIRIMKGGKDESK